jgi:exodeoxyribonuclease VII large subunit
MKEDIVEQDKEIISVGELNRSAKYLLENTFNNIAVVGEISNMSRPSSGHIYFTLKDEDGAIGCAMWRSQASRLNFSPENGDQCILKGQVSLYPATGRYQLMVKSIEQAGSGNLMQQFEMLKNKLDEEGLFNLNNKKGIPKSPKHIGIITSESTAALQDILTSIERRAPSAQISLSPAVVQGDNAPSTIIKALNRIIIFNEKNPDSKIDVVIIARGGGSIEDLWCFNNEDLAREIAAYPIPTISGVGHEIDFTICDFVSDMRTPTPTAAAELVSEFYFKIQDKLDDLNLALLKSIEQLLRTKKQFMKGLKSSIKNPLMILREQSQKLDNFELRLNQKISLNYAKKNQAIKLLSSRLLQKSPSSFLKELNNKISNTDLNLKKNIKRKISFNKTQLAEYDKNLSILNPLSILDRGYSIIQKKSGESVKSSNEVEMGEVLSARLSEGFIEVKVKKI